MNETLNNIRLIHIINVKEDFNINFKNNLIKNLFCSQT